MSAELGVCFCDGEIELRLKNKVEREGIQSADRGVRVKGRATENAGMSTVTDWHLSSMTVTKLCLRSKANTHTHAKTQ